MEARKREEMELIKMQVSHSEQKWGGGRRLFFFGIVQPVQNKIPFQRTDGTV